MHALDTTTTAPRANPRQLIGLLVTAHLLAAAALLLTGLSTPFLMDGESPLLNYLTPVALGLVIAVVELIWLAPRTVATAWVVTLAVNAGAVVFVLPVVILYTTAVAAAVALLVCGPAALGRRLHA